MCYMGKPIMALGCYHKQYGVTVIPLQVRTLRLAGGGLSLGFIVEKRQVIYISSSSFEESASFLSRFSGDTADAWEMLGYADGTVHLGCLPYIQK